MTADLCFYGISGMNVTLAFILLGNIFSHYLKDVRRQFIPKLNNEYKCGGNINSQTYLHVHYVLFDVSLSVNCMINNTVLIHLSCRNKNMK